jgi:hypothetical protein
MSVIQCKRQPSRFNAQCSSVEPSAAAKLIELGAALAGAESNGSVLGSCFHCLAPRDAYSSTAHFPNVFCSDRCEREFIRVALASLTVEDCVRMHRRLETLLRGTKHLPFEGDRQ